MWCWIVWIVFKCSCRYSLFKLFKNVQFVVDCVILFTVVPGCFELFQFGSIRTQLFLSRGLFDLIQLFFSFSSGCQNSFTLFDALRVV